MNAFQDLVKYFTKKVIPTDDKIVLGTDNITEEMSTSWRGNTVHHKIIIEWDEWEKLSSGQKD